MRKKLKIINEIRKTFIGQFVRFGTKSGYMGIERTILLKDIKDLEGHIISNHLWFNYTKGFEKINLQENDVIKFDARVKEYERGYKGYKEGIYKPIELDYKLSHPTKIEKILI